MKKTASTISLKPQLPAANLESWITGGANQNETAPQETPALKPTRKPSSRPANKQAGKPASKQDSLQADDERPTQPVPALTPMRMLSVRIPSPLHQELRVHSVSRGRPIQDIVTALLADYRAGKLASRQASLQSDSAAEEATKMLSVRIPASLHHELRVQAVCEGRQIQDIVVHLLRGYLSFGS